MQTEKTVKVFCKDKVLHGLKINLPVVGEVEIEKDGSVEVSEDVATMLTKQNPSWTYSLEGEASKEEHEGEKAPKKEKEKAAKDEGEEEEDDVKDILGKMTLNQLVEMAESAQYPEAEYKKFKTNKKLMLAFMVKKANEEK